MAAGYRSYYAFWVGGMSAYPGVVPSAATYVVGEIVVYPALEGRPSVEPALSGRPRQNRGR